MRNALMLLSLIAPLWTALPEPAQADVKANAGGLQASMAPAGDPGLRCRRAVAQAGHDAGIPDHLMSAIARVESGRRGPDGQVNPWPWSINVEGTDHIYDTREAAIAAVRQLQAMGVRSIDVGCMQVNLMHHAQAFATLEQAFDPAANAAYAARFLSELFGQTGSWTKATAFYHSATAERGDPYQRKVAAVLAEETDKDTALLGPTEGARAPGVFTASEGALMLSNRSDAARILPAASPGTARGLEAYRAAPVRVALSSR